MQERAVNLEAIGPVHALGEGLFVGGNGELSMVDISRKKIFCGRDRQLSVTCDFVPTAIIGAEGPFLDVVTDRGRVRWDARTMTSSWVNAWRGHIHGGADFRSNDAVMSSCGRLLVGFMSRNDPTHDAGYIYMQERDGELKLLADDIFIPNTFIEIEPNIFLISDSSKSVVHRFEFDSAGKVVSRTVFTEYSRSVTRSLLRYGVGAPYQCFLCLALKRREFQCQ